MSIISFQFIDPDAGKYFCTVEVPFTDYKMRVNDKLIIPDARLRLNHFDGSYNYLRGIVDKRVLWALCDYTPEGAEYTIVSAYARAYIDNYVYRIMSNPAFI